MKEEIIIASDHAGFEMKQEIIKHLLSRNIKVIDLGTNTLDSVDYPDFGHKLGEEISNGNFEKAISICGSGNGINMTTNKHKGVRGALYWNEEKKAGLKEIAERLDIPSPFLGKILQSLARKKILHSSKGPNGGFCLARPAEDIPLMDIITIIDGTEIFDSCLIRTSKCGDEEPCAIHDSITRVREELKNFLLNQTIGDLGTEFKRDNKRIKI